MATVTIRETFSVDDVLTNMTTVKLSDPTAAYGVKRNDTDAVVVADATAMTNAAAGVYTYTFTSPADDLTFTAWVEWVYGGETFRYERTIVGPVSADTDLITLAELKTHLSIDSADYDDELNQAISGALSLADTLTNRTLLSTSHAEWLNGPGDPVLIMRNFPITAVGRVSIGEVGCMTVKCGATDATQATVSVSTTAVTLTIADGASAGTTSLAFADYATLTLMAAAINATAGSWTATPLGSYGGYRSTMLRPVGGLYCLEGVQAMLTMPEQPASGMRLRWGDGFILADGGYFPEGLGNIYVEYTAGYTNTTAPAALKEALMEIAAGIYHAGQHDLTLKSERLGDYAWTAADGDSVSRDKYTTWLAPFVSGTF